MSLYFKKKEKKKEKQRKKKKSKEKKERKKKSKGNIIQQYNNFLLFLWLENKLNGFECSLVLTRGINLLDLQIKLHPLILLPF